MRVPHALRAPGRSPSCFWRAFEAPRERASAVFEPRSPSEPSSLRAARPAFSPGSGKGPTGSVPQDLDHFVAARPSCGASSRGTPRAPSRPSFAPPGLEPRLDSHSAAGASSSSEHSGAVALYVFRGGAGWESIDRTVHRGVRRAPFPCLSSEGELADVWGLEPPPHSDLLPLWTRRIRT